MGGRLKKEGTYIYLWLIHGYVCQKPTQYCKATILQLKKKKKKKTHNIQKTRIMAFGPITSWQTNGGNVERVAILISWALKSP